jgi:hypothetical protein
MHPKYLRSEKGGKYVSTYIRGQPTLLCPQMAAKPLTERIPQGIELFLSIVGIPDLSSI